MKRTKIITLWVLAVALCATCVATCAFAQRGGPGGPGRPGGPPPPPVLKAGSDGVFTLLGGLLVKFDAATLRQAGTLQLLDRPAPPPEGAQGDRPIGPPPRGELLLASAISGHGKVLALFGDQLFIVDAVTLKLAHKVMLPKPPPPPGQGPGDASQGLPPPPRFGPPMPMALELHGQMLYILRGPQLTAVNITDGSITQGMLPAPKPPGQGGAP